VCRGDDEPHILRPAHLGEDAQRLFLRRGDHSLFLVMPSVSLVMGGPRSAAACYKRRRKRPGGGWLLRALAQCACRYVVVAVALRAIVQVPVVPGVRFAICPSRHFLMNGLLAALLVVLTESGAAVVVLFRIATETHFLRSGGSSW